MTYVVILVVTLLIIAPIIAVLPSKRQKEQMALRRRAMTAGINVELTSITDPIPKQDKYLSNTGKQLEPRLSVAAYRLARKTPSLWRQAPPVDWAVERRATGSGDGLPGTWCWHPNKPPELNADLADYISTHLTSLPADVVRIDEVRRVVSIYWHERSGDAGLQIITGLLVGCTGINAHVEPDDSEDEGDHL